MCQYFWTANVVHFHKRKKLYTPCLICFNALVYKYFTFTVNNIALYDVEEVQLKKLNMKKSHIYTKTGDAGKTSLVGGTRVAKSHVRLEAYGTVDELNSFVGLLICQIEDEDVNKVLSFIQHKLFTVGSYLATEEDAKLNEASIVKDQDIELLEKEMDRMDSQLPPIRQFILPGGCEPAARAHICRSVCRRAERAMYRVKDEYEVDANVMKFVNRLSDYFFLLARKECNKNGKEIFWDTSCIS